MGVELVRQRLSGREVGVQYTSAFLYGEPKDNKIILFQELN
jgi:hypothetical protein